MPAEPDPVQPSVPVREIVVGGPDDGPYGVTVTADGTVVFTLVHAGALGRLTPDWPGRPDRSGQPDGAVTRVPLDPAGQPMVVTGGPDGAVWLTENATGRIVRVTADGDTTAVPTPDPAARPYGIVTGPDGALWYTAGATDRIGRVDPDRLDAIEHPIPLAGGFPAAITAGADGALWFALNQGDAIGRMTTDGACELVPLAPGTAPVGITTGPDGAIWFVGIGADVVGRVGADHTVTTHPLDPGARPHAITAGPDGALWFTEWGSGRVGRLSPDGRRTHVDLPTPGAEPHGLAAAPDGRLWVALEIGRLAVLDIPGLGTDTPGAGAGEPAGR